VFIAKIERDANISEGLHRKQKSKHVHIVYGHITTNHHWVTITCCGRIYFKLLQKNISIEKTCTRTNKG